MSNARPFLVGSIGRATGTGASLAPAAIAALLLATVGCNRPLDPPHRVVHAVSGTVSGAIAAGVTVSLSGSWTASTTTDSSGSFRFADLANGNYAVAPSVAGYALSPAALAFTVNGADVANLAFVSTISTAPTYSISGTVSGLVGSEITALLSGDVVGSVFTDSGHFVFNGIANGSYTVTPSDPRYLFDPLASLVTVNGAHVGGVDFGATASAAPTYTISGTVSGDVVSGVLVGLTGDTIAATTTQADGSGHYAFPGLAEGIYTVTPLDSSCVFDPDKATVTVATENVDGVDFASTVRGSPGALDESFDGEGILTDAADGSGSTFYAVVVQADGKILAGGVKGSGGWMIRRFERDGAPDATFNGNAAAAMPVTGELRGLAVDSNTGRVVCIGSSSVGSAAQLTVVRLNSSGTAHTSFGNSGVVRFDTVNYPNGSSGYAALVLSDSSIVVAGAWKNGTTDHALLDRLDPATGARYSGFALYFGGRASAFYGLGLWQDRIVAGGADDSTGPPSTLIVRMSSSGALDSGFGAGGAYSSNDHCRAKAVVVQPDGHVAAAGQADFKSRCAARATSSGASEWTVITTYQSNDTYAGVATMPDGRVLAAGHGGGQDKQAWIARFNANGTADSSFGTAGTVTLQDESSPDGYFYQLHALTVQPDGRIITAGNNNDAGAVLMRSWL